MIKKVGSSLYAHKSNCQELFADKHISDEDYEHIRTIVYGLQGFLSYDVIKFDYKNRKLSLIRSRDWDTANEPSVGRSIVYDISIGKDLSDTPSKTIKARNQIYHNRWMFVSDDYDGFDIEQAKERTKQWSSIPFLDKKRIGNKNYWIEVLKANGLEV